MPFNDPGAGARDLEGDFVLQLVRLEDAKPGTFGERMQWVFHVYDTDGAGPYEDEAGGVFEWYEWTSTKTGRGSNAKKLGEALLGREFTKDDTGAWLTENLPGKWMRVRIADKFNDEGEGFRTIVKQAAHEGFAKEAVGAVASSAGGTVSAPAEDEELPF